MPTPDPLATAQPMPLDALQAASLGGDGHTMEPACQLALDANFGDLQAWRAAFAACALAHSGNAGWVLLVFQPHLGTLANQWAHGPGQVADGGVPILATALRLRAAGLNARFLHGGIDAWQAAGRPLVANPAG